MIPQRGVPKRNNAGLNKPAPFLFYSLAKLKRLTSFQRLTLSILQWGVPQRNNVRLSKPAPFLFYSLTKLKRLARFKTKNAPLQGALVLCREKGIRTLDMLPYTRFPSVRLQPLGHLSILLRLQRTRKKLS